MRRMLKAGTSSKGFTLIELALVIFIIGLVLGLVFPRLIDLTGGSVRGTTQHLVRSIQILMDRATATKHLYRLNYDIENGRYWATVMGSEGQFEPVDPQLVQPVTLKEPIRFKDIVTLRQGKVTEGEAFTQFYPSGRVERTFVHLARGDDDEEEVTMIIEPLTGRIRLKDGYVEEK
jgi:general secretion pathway protein H